MGVHSPSMGKGNSSCARVPVLVCMRMVVICSSLHSSCATTPCLRQQLQRDGALPGDDCWSIIWRHQRCACARRNGCTDRFSVLECRFAQHQAAAILLHCVQLALWCCAGHNDVRRDSACPRRERQRGRMVSRTVPQTWSSSSDSSRCAYCTVCRRVCFVCKVHSMSLLARVHLWVTTPHVACSSLSCSTAFRAPRALNAPLCGGHRAVTRTGGVHTSCRCMHFMHVLQVHVCCACACLTLSGKSRI